METLRTRVEPTTLCPVTCWPPLGHPSSLAKARLLSGRTTIQRSPVTGINVLKGQFASNTPANA